MRIELSEELERYLRDQVASGKFSSETEVVEAALRLMKDRAEKRAAVRMAMLDEEGAALPARN